MVKRVLGIALVWALLTGFTFPVIELQAKPGAEPIGFDGVGIRLEAREGYQTVPLDWVEQALHHHTYPFDIEALLGAEFPIYRTNMQILYGDAEPVAVTIGGELILFSGAREPKRADIEETVLHEVAHALATRMMSEQRWTDYRKLRGLGPEYRQNGLWQRRPTEIFAEDFAHLFGTFHARQAEWPFPELPEPDAVTGLREFFVSLAGEKAPVRVERQASLFDWMHNLAKVPGYPPYPATLPWEGGGTLTRAQAAFLLSRALPPAKGQRAVARKDGSDWPAWAVGAIEQVQQHGILPALPDGRFDPNGFLTEREAALAIKKLRLMLIIRNSPERPGTGKIMFR